MPRTAAPAKARFLYIPESYGDTVSGLQRLPSSMISLLSSPLLPALLSAVIPEPLKRANRPPEADDESLDAFLSRRFGPTFARIFGSALVHGVYASDSRMLSVRAAFPILWQAEERGRGSVVRGFLTSTGKRKDENEGYELGRVADLMHGKSVYSFKDGMETLTTAIEEHLDASPNVRIYKNAEVSGIKSLQDHSIEVRFPDVRFMDFTHCILGFSLIRRAGHRDTSSLCTPSSTTPPSIVAFQCNPKLARESDIHSLCCELLVPLFAFKASSRRFWIPNPSSTLGLPD